MEKLGYTGLEGKSLYDLPVPIQEKVKPLYDRCLAGETFSTSYQSVNHDTHYTLYFQPIRNSKDQVIAGQILLAENTKSVHDEQKLFRLKERSDRGKVAGEIAGEINALAQKLYSKKSCSTGEPCPDLAILADKMTGLSSDIQLIHGLFRVPEFERGLELDLIIEMACRNQAGVHYDLEPCLISKGHPQLLSSVLRDLLNSLHVPVIVKLKNGLLTISSLRLLEASDRQQSVIEGVLDRHGVTMQTVNTPDQHTITIDFKPIQLQKQELSKCHRLTH